MLKSLESCFGSEKKFFDEKKTYDISQLSLATDT